MVICISTTGVWHSVSCLNLKVESSQERVEIKGGAKGQREKNHIYGCRNEDCFRIRRKQKEVEGMGLGVNKNKIHI